MRLARLGDVGAERPVLIHDDVAYDASEHLTDRDSWWDEQVLHELDRARQAGTLSVVPQWPALRVGAPIPRPGAVVCIGMNYAAHAAESGAEPPAQPVMFYKAPNTVVGPHDPLVIPRDSIRTDWEVELGVVIGRRASYLDSPRDALAHVAGYVLANDLSERSWQLDVSGGQWSKGKVAPGFTPLGPWFVTADEIEPHSLRLRSWVNGEARQDSVTGDMVFDVAAIVHHLSQYTTMDPGDLVLTGTPEGVALSGRFPYLAPGDEVEVEIDGLGRQHQVARAWTEADRV